MSALFIVPQFTEIAYAKAVDAGTQKNPTKCNMAEDSYEIDSGGWYEFTGETVSNYIEVSSKETAYIDIYFINGQNFSKRKPFHMDVTLENIMNIGRRYFELTCNRREGKGVIAEGFND